jgi:hypothetical protein
MAVFKSWKIAMAGIKKNSFFSVPDVRFFLSFSGARAEEWSCQPANVHGIIETNKYIVYDYPRFFWKRSFPHNVLCFILHGSFCI